MNDRELNAMRYSRKCARNMARKTRRNQQRMDKLLTLAAPFAGGMLTVACIMWAML